ncbi:MAG: pyridoxamine 5'-phosphate oxidase family protein [Spirochaetales bacterium]|uniref:Pyridoxamine 5'-phosphate oxidase family protein n=1 Tax=Candidatus Thalassospirochaeta sargassi TaxID=3119039 RepID=A0AAJ1IG64_9SPIO|nr:pyridoxamine 5'-phosphate oxidase family protein [Spirochaetales bacterium]
MRRSKQEITDSTEIQNIISRARTARLGINREGAPYVLPMNFGFADNTFYFHCADSGLKLDLLQADPRVCIEIDESSELQTGEVSNPCKWGVNYRSVIAIGTAEILTDIDLKRTALKIIISQFAGNNAPEMPEASIKATTVFRVKSENLTAKHSS